MNPLSIAALAAVTVAAITWWLRRRAAARRAACREDLADLLRRERPRLSLTRGEPGRWLLRHDGADLATVDGRSLTRAITADPGARRRLFLATADAATSGPRPFAGRFELQDHGARTLPRLADEALALLALEPAPVRHVAADAAGLATIYVVDGEPHPAYVTEDHLGGAGIDARDLHNVALAVLRQRFDEAEPRRALAGEGVVTMAPEDGCGGSRILLLPEALRRDETLFAAAPAPGLLLVAAERRALDDALTAAGVLIDADLSPIGGGGFGGQFGQFPFTVFADQTGLGN